MQLEEKYMEVLVELLGEMTDRDPSSRPEMAHALSVLLNLREGLSTNVLLGDAKEQDWNIAL